MKTIKEPEVGTEGTERSEENQTYLEVGSEGNEEAMRDPEVCTRVLRKP